LSLIEVTNFVSTLLAFYKKNFFLLKVKYFKERRGRLMLRGEEVDLFKERRG